MKFTKRILSIAMAMVMLCSLMVVSAVTASAEETMGYDDNVLASYDQYIMDYGYGTGISANWPRQVTFNNDGWMRIQSRTAEEVAADEVGTASKQWQYYGHATPEYDAQLHNAVEKSEGIAAVYTYIKSGGNADGEGSPTVETELHLGIVFDENNDGKFDEPVNNSILSCMPRTQINSKYGFRYSVGLIDLSSLLESEHEYKLVSISVNIQNYDGILAKLDAFVSPVYTTNVPGSDVSINAEGNFNAEASISEGSFTINNGDFNVDDWTWEYPNADDPIKENEDKDSMYKRGDIVRDENNYPLNKNGIAFVKSPITMVIIYPDAKVSGLKVVSKTSTSVTLSWTGEDAIRYFINEKDGKVDNVTGITATTATVYGVREGQTYNFRVRGYNRANKPGNYTEYLTVSIPVTVVKPSTPVMASATVTAAKTVTVKWNKANNAKTYDVQRQIGSKAWTTVKSGLTTTSYVDKAASAGGTYSYRVVAKNGSYTATSASKTVKVMAYTTKPVVKTAKAGTKKKTLDVTLKSKITNATGYEIKVGTNSKITKGTKTVKATNTKATISGLKSKSLYYVKVRPYQKVGSKVYYGAWSAVKKASNKVK